jgi:hypothetical protein
MDEQIYRRATPLLEADVGDELVALDPESGVCFGFNSVAASVWRLLEEPKTARQIKDCLMETFEVSPTQCAEELQALLDSLVDQGIVDRG